MKKWTILLVLFLLATMTITPVSAQGGGDNGQVVFGGTYTLRAGETLPGDLAVFGGQATIEEGAVVAGDVVAFGGQLEIAGHVQGDLAAFGGTVHLARSAKVDGDLAGFGQVTQEPGAQVQGKKVEGFQFKFGLPDSIVSPQKIPFSVTGRGLEPGTTLLALMIRVIRTLLTILAVTAIGALAVVLLPKQTRQVSETAQQSLAPTFGVGCLGLVVLALASTVLAITIIGLLAIPFLWMAAAVVILFGWIAMGLLVGERVLQALHFTGVTPIVSAIIGVFVISLLAAAPSCIGPLFTVLVASLGLGAVILSRLGTRPYPDETTSLPVVTIANQQ
ncbi:MAG: hypothetical protein GXP41_11955 [Chloroflexi bacterium]|nr:hypothetical protein [Chloroflexota bacterium]